jgi:hypothetical protein
MAALFRAAAAGLTGVLGSGLLAVLKPGVIANGLVLEQQRLAVPLLRLVLRPSLRLILLQLLSHAGSS